MLAALLVDLDDVLVGLIELSKHCKLAQTLNRSVRIRQTVCKDVSSQELVLADSVCED